MTHPDDRYAAGMAFDQVTNSVVLLGGFSSGPALNDTWILAIADRRRSSVLVHVPRLA